MASVMAAAGVSVIVFSAFSQFMILQSKNAVAIQRKVQAYNTLTVLNRTAANLDSCSCFFDMENTLNPAAPGTSNPLRSPALALQIQPAQVRQLQSQGVEGPSLVLPWFALVPKANGFCRYDRARTIAAPNLFLGNESYGLLIKSVELRNIRSVGNFNQHKYRGTLTVAFDNAVTNGGASVANTPMEALESDVVFYTDAAGRPRTCQSREAIDQFFKEKVIHFEGVLTQENMAIQQEVSGDLANILSVYGDEVTGRVIVDSEAEFERILNEARAALR